MTQRRQRKLGLIDRLERKFGRFAIRNLVRFIIGFSIAGTIIFLVWPEIYMQYLSLDWYQIIHNFQVWRLLSFMIVPPTSVDTENYGNLIWVAFEIYIYFIMGTSIENAIGTFKFNLYYLLGWFFIVFGNLGAYLLAGFVFGEYEATSALIGMMCFTCFAYVNRSMIMLFATIYPDAEFLLFFFIPVKAKWLGWIDGIIYGVYFVKYIVQGVQLQNGELGIYSLVYYFMAFLILLSFLNFIIFFFAINNKRNSYNKPSKAAKAFGRKIKEGQKKSSVHKCCICGRTSEDHPELQFRYCSKCTGNKEYCSDHLFTHVHE